MKFNICVPLPIKSTSILELKSIIEESFKFDPNLIELRYDYINDVKQITKKFVNELLADTQHKIPFIFTFRAYREGGQMKIDEQTRFKILKILILSQPDYLDIEMNIDNRVLNDIIYLANQNKVNLIFSYHDFDKTPSYDMVSERIQNFSDRLREECGLDSKKIKKVILKTIFTAQKFEDNLIPLRLCKELTKKNMKIISFCMGNLGIFSRILCVLNGSFLTYGSIDQKTAPGQVNITKIRETLNLLQKK
ncbi:MAG: type I 3-dehydroquinate dehydratase [Candidatus Thorarchaeota archaeon]